AQAFRRLGSEEVTVVEGSDRLLAREEPFAGQEVREAFQEEGITVITSAKVIGVHRPAESVVATLENGRTVEADEILVGVGRRPNTKDVGAETVGLKPGEWFGVDDRLR